MVGAATELFEYIHLDFYHMSLFTNRYKCVLLVVDDLSGTAVFKPAQRDTGENATCVIVEDWLSIH